MWFYVTLDGFKYFINFDNTSTLKLNFQSILKND